MPDTVEAVQYWNGVLERFTYAEIAYSEATQALQRYDTELAIEFGRKVLEHLRAVELHSKVYPRGWRGISKGVLRFCGALKKTIDSGRMARDPRKHLLCDVVILDGILESCWASAISKVPPSMRSYFAHPRMIEIIAQNSLKGR